jgi:hypothetical protein
MELVGRKCRLEGRAAVVYRFQVPSRRTRPSVHVDISLVIVGIPLSGLGFSAISHSVWKFEVYALDRAGVFRENAIKVALPPLIL